MFENFICGSGNNFSQFLQVTICQLCRLLKSIKRSFRLRCMLQSTTKWTIRRNVPVKYIVKVSSVEIRTKVFCGRFRRFESRKTLSMINKVLICFVCKRTCAFRVCSITWFFSVAYISFRIALLLYLYLKVKSNITIFP